MLALFAGSAVSAKPYVDYTPQKGVWEINQIDVDPNHVDDYLVGLQKTQFPGFDIMKKRGMIDEYHVFVRMGYSKATASVIIQTHYTSMAALEPDKARDEAIDKDIMATLPEEAGKAAVAGYEKYRSFVDDSFWSEVKMTR